MRIGQGGDRFSRFAAECITCDLILFPTVYYVSACGVHRQFVHSGTPLIRAVERDCTNDIFAGQKSYRQSARLQAVTVVVIIPDLFDCKRNRIRFVGQHQVRLVAVSRCIAKRVFVYGLSCPAVLYRLSVAVYRHVGHRSGPIILGSQLD